MLLSNRVAVITGGASGVGREAAKLFAQEGASVVIGDVLEDAAAETVRMVEDLGGRIAYAPTDVTQEASVKSLMHQAVASFGGLDIVLNNAGVPSPNPPKDTWEFTDADYDRLMDTNLRGVFYGCKHAIPLLIQRG
ncbi:MAG: SDR family NAD(P)-dependent oxidoreductase, partial [Chloroflexi bacterium]|nr:SDR family NAD(P)-dependent oxidoreductase [Chloroflexota bacterium]